MNRTTLLLACAMITLLAAAQQPKEGRLENISRITNGAERYENPRWSPDGNKIAMSGDGFDGLYVINSNGQGLIQLSNATGVGYMYQWSADSREILVRDTRWLSTPNGLERVHAAWSVGLDGKKTRLTADQESMQPAAWRYSRSGARSIVSQAPLTKAPLTKIPSTLAVKAIDQHSANVSFITDYENLYIVDAEGNQRVLREGPALCPALSPDGKKVAFVENDYVMVINTDGSGCRKIARGFHPSWVNNTQIVYERTDDNGHEYTAGELYINNVTGNAEKALTATNNLIEMWPCVSADGNKIVFTSTTDGQVYSADLR